MHEVREARITTGSVTLTGDLALADEDRALVIFAHGSGSSRHSPRNRQVAACLRESRLATLLLDLLTPEEEEIDLRTREFRFDIDRLGRRVTGACDWAREQLTTRNLPLGLFGASTGAAAALRAAAARPDEVGAVVSRGGRPDLAGDALSAVRAPTLLIVGGADRAVLSLNRSALEPMAGVKELAIVADATHLFEEPGALGEVARLAAEWFARHLFRP